MARYSRRRGPAADLALTLAGVEVTALTITRFFDEGELLLLFRCGIGNGTAGPITFRARLQIDGVNVSTLPPRNTIAAFLSGFLADAILAPVTAGIHTIRVMVEGSDIAGDILEQDTASLSVIQLPLWDTDADVT